MEITCPNCKQPFALDNPAGVQIAICPSCDAPFKLARGATLPPRVGLVERAPEPATFSDSHAALSYNASIANAPRSPGRGANWLIWIAVGFAAVWVLAILAMLFTLQHSRKSVATTPPPAPPAVVQPSPTPPAQQPSIFSEEPAPPAPAPPPSPPTASTTPPPADRSADAEPRPEPRPAGPPPLRVVPDKAALSDADIGNALERGVSFILSQFDGEEIDPSLTDNEVDHAGLNALCMYALLHTSQAIRDSRISPASTFMRSAIERMKKHPIRPLARANLPVVYARSLRASALTVYNRPEDHAAWRADVAWLIAASHNGAYTYDDYYIVPSTDPEKPDPIRKPRTEIEGRPAVSFSPDNSNSQYGLLGVWAGAERGYQVSDLYWRAVERHWNSKQLPTGEWRYNGGWPSLNMTVAGIASLMVAHDYLDALTAERPGARRPFSQQIQRGLQWLESGDNVLMVHGPHFGYGLYGIERVGLASGYKYFGRHDWYRTLTQRVLPMQLENGAFHGDRRQALIDTSFILLFLSRGRHPVMMNKLRYDGNWANRPRDGGKLADYATQALERPINWQVVDVRRNWIEWTDAPILYIAGDQVPDLTEAEYDKIVRFAEAGGLVFTHADGGSAAFTQFAEKLGGMMVPGELQDLSSNHPIYSMQFNVEAPRPRLRGMSNGSRLLLVHAPDDFATAWQARDPKRRRAAMELAINLYIYATGKAPLLNRIEAPYLDAPPGQPTRTIPLARVQYGGAWDPEPAAWRRFARYLQWETGWAVQPAPVQPEQLNVKQHPIAHLTGTAPDTANDEALAALRKYVEDGGVLVIDVCGGAPGFFRTLEENWLPRILRGLALEPLAPDDPILTGKMETMTDAADDLTSPQLRPYAIEQIGRTGNRIKTLHLGKGRIIYSSIDLTSGLLGTNTWGILGYSPAYSQALVKNIVLWTLWNNDQRQN